MDSIGFSMYSIMSSENTDSFASFFLIWMPFRVFSYLIAVARTSNTMLNRSGESGHPCLVPDLSAKEKLCIRLRDVKYSTGNIVNNIVITMYGNIWILEISGDHSIMYMIF